MSVPVQNDASGSDTNKHKHCIADRYRVGVIGTGKFAQALAKRLSRYGYR